MIFLHKRNWQDFEKRQNQKIITFNKEIRKDVVAMKLNIYINVGAFQLVLFYGFFEKLSADQLAAVRISQNQAE